MQFNELKFLTEVQRIHLNQEEIGIYKAIQKSDVRSKLNNFVDCGNNLRFSNALETICKNLVGITMFKLLITKIMTNETWKKRGKIKIIEHSENGSRYSPTDFAVKINLSFYEGDGNGIISRQYYCINGEENIEIKLKSLAGSIFHEFCHALHHVSETYIFEVKKTCQSCRIEDIWGNYEELRTICCLDHDPICEHCFDFFMNGDSFRPRYTHGGFTEGKRSEQEEIERREKFKQNLPLSKKFMDGWKEYMI